MILIIHAFQDHVISPVKLVNHKTYHHVYRVIKGDFYLKINVYQIVLPDTIKNSKIILVIPAIHPVKRAINKLTIVVFHAKLINIC